MIHIPRALGRIPVLRGVARLCLTAYARLFRDRYMIERRMGLRLLLDQQNAIDWQFFIKGGWEKEQVSFLFKLAIEQWLQSNGGVVFFDIGAHWGMYALEAHKRGMFDRIVAFEPDPANFAQLQANLFLNDAVQSIEALQLAASNADRLVGLALETQRNRGGTRVVEIDQPHHAVCRSVRVDRQFDLAGKLLVIKIDVEGHEVATLEGLEGLLAQNRCLIQVEADEEVSPGSLEKVTVLLARHGLVRVRSMQIDHYFVPGPRPGDGSPVGTQEQVRGLILS